MAVAARGTGTSRKSTKAMALQMDGFGRRCGELLSRMAQRVDLAAGAPARYLAGRRVLRGRDLAVPRNEEGPASAAEGAEDGNGDGFGGI